MLEFQINLLTAWWAAADAARTHVASDRDRGEVTAQTAMIVLLVIAGMATAGLGYHAKEMPWNPTLWAYYDYASGDDDPNAGDFTTFNQLFAFGHYYLGWLDVVGRQNIHDVSAAMYLYPANWLTVWLQYHNFWLASPRDALYSAGGVALRRDYDRFDAAYRDLLVAWFRTDAATA